MPRTDYHGDKHVFRAHLFPERKDLQDLGSPLHRWRNLYAQNLVSDSATFGDLVITDDLVVGNNFIITGPSPWVDVTAFGATGDGVTDDRAAIALAVASIPASGGTLYFPPGTYVTTTTSPVLSLSNRNQIRVVGSGIGTTVLKSTAAGRVIEVIKGAGSETVNMTFSDFSVEGSNVATVAIYCDTLKRSLFRRLNLNGTIDYGFNIVGSSSQVNMIEDSFITAASTGANTSGSGLLAAGNALRIVNTYFNIGGNSTTPRWANCMDVTSNDQTTCIGNIYDGAPTGIRTSGKLIDVGGYFEPSATTGLWTAGVTITSNNSVVIAQPRSFDPNKVTYSGGATAANLTHLAGATNTAIVAGQPVGLTLTPAALSANTDNYAPVDASSMTGLYYRTWRISSSGSINLTGITAGIDGQYLDIINVGANAITLQRNSGSSSAANQLETVTGSVSLAQHQGATFCYDGTTAKWRLVGVGQAVVSAGSTEILFGAGSSRVTSSANLVFASNTLTVTGDIVATSQIGAGAAAPSGVDLFVKNTGTGVARIVRATDANGIELAFDDSAGYISTTTTVPLVFRYNNVESFRIDGTYALFVDSGLARFDGNGTRVFELPADATDPTGGGGAATGRIPVLIGGATRYLAYY